MQSIDGKSKVVLVKAALRILQVSLVTCAQTSTHIPVRLFSSHPACALCGQRTPLPAHFYMTRGRLFAELLPLSSEVYALRNHMHGMSQTI